MAFQPNKNCNTCKRVKADKNLYRRIFASKFYVKGGEPLIQISREENVEYQSLTVHVKKHQHLTEDRLVKSQLDEIAKSESRRAVAEVIRTNDARATVMEKLARKAESADLDDLTTKDLLVLLLKAMKDTDDVSAKAKDQDIDILKMMGGVRAGEVAETAQVYEEFDPWQELEEGTVAE